MIDVTDPQVGDELQSAMAEMLTMRNSPEEKMIGFEVTENKLITSAWQNSLLYQRNSVTKKKWASAYNYFMLFMNLFIVFAVVIKQALYPAVPTDMCSQGGKNKVAAQSRRVGELMGGTGGGDEDQVYFVYLWSIYCIGPILSGIILTFNNAFSPLNKVCEPSPAQPPRRAVQRLRGGWAPSHTAPLLPCHAMPCRCRCRCR